MISSRGAMRIDNKINPRKVTGWTLRGSSYRGGRKLPGATILNLEGGGILYYTESTSLAAALDDADTRGFVTTGVRADLKTWIKTGNGATFSVE